MQTIKRICLLRYQPPISIVRVHLQTSSTSLGVDKSHLSKLRKKTGFSFVNCKNALQKFDNDLVKAENWLQEQSQKEGWSKASKLQNRPMSQGLVGVIVDSNSAAMVELNCETDFVARNSKFQKLACLATSAILQHGRGSGTPKLILNREELAAVKADNERTLADIIAMEIGNIRENMVLKRAAYITSGPDQKLGSYVHSAGKSMPKEGACSLGKYGALLTLSQDPDATGLKPDVLGQQLGQHIVGMNPRTVGNPEDKPEKDSDDETKLLLQEFLLDPSMTVAELLKANSTTVTDFIRFECGEDLEKLQQEDKS